jgi:AhpD family alkylhydroperoxidase
MSRIDAAGADAKLPPGAAEILRFSEASGAPDPRMARVLVRSAAGVGFLEYWTHALYEGELPHRLKEIVRIYLSASQGCAYCSVVRSTRGAEEGVNDALLLALDDIDANPYLTERERAALQFAARFKRGEADDERVFDALRARFSDSEILELGLFCGTVVGIGSFAKLLKVVTWDEVCALDPNMRKLRRLGDR